MTNVDNAVKQYRKKNAPVLRPGFVVRVSEKIVEGGKERVQVFEGLVLSVKHGKGMNGMFTVRKIASGRIGVERTFPLHMLLLEKIEVLREEKVRRAKLYFIRDQINKKTKKRKTQERHTVFDLTEQGVEEENANTAETSNETEQTEKEPVQTPASDSVKNDEVSTGESSGEETSQSSDKNTKKDEQPVQQDIPQGKADSTAG